MTRTLTQDELVEEARSKFGDNPLNWAFTCPSCGDVATGRDFKKALTAHPRTRDGQPVTASDVLGQECIGRTLGALATPPTHQRGCDWAAYGLIGGPWTVTLPEGRTIHAFPLAEAGAR
jgi:hypothetical protein